MEQNRKDQPFTQAPQKKAEMPGTASRPEIDLPLKGGRAESDLSSTTKTQPVKQPSRDDKAGSERSSR